jgi:hypothetical protein
MAVTPFSTRSFTEFILSKAEGFRMTTSIKCHSERTRGIFLGAKFGGEIEMSHYRIRRSLERIIGLLLSEKLISSWEVSCNFAESIPARMANLILRI